jgi:hypothetical protein
MVALEKKKSVSAGGILGALIFLIGVGVLFVNALLGVGIIILALIIGMVGRGKQIIMVCPSCGNKGKAIDI